MRNSGNHKGGILKRYRVVILAILANLVLWLLSPDKARISLGTTGSVFKEMLMILPPVFFLVGMLDQWVPREVIEKYVGHGSGVKGMVISLLLGSATVGPLYAGFPLAAMLLKKGARMSNVVAFLTAKAAAEVPLIVMESKFLGAGFALVRVSLTFAAAIAMGWIMERISRGWSEADSDSVSPKPAE
ncbi:MAG: permease [Firmicutes bacterium]|jgi:uncharacterized membrane protein YraQ (UPF0718 family)|nr:permease [Bacillota bacterium]